MIVDIHCHYTFTQRLAAVGDRFSFEPRENDDGPAYDSWLAPRVLRRPTTPILQRFYGLDPRLEPGAELDRQLEAWYGRHLRVPGPVERTVLLAFDDYHDDAGRRSPRPIHRGQFGNDMYTSNTFVRAACQRWPRNYLFGASVHPYRANALECIDEVFQGGACLLKWIPQHQNIDCQDERTLRVLRHCAELGLPLLVHYGEEFTLATQHRKFVPIKPFLEVLLRLKGEGRMPTVIVPHVATPVTPLGSSQSCRLLIDALRGEFAKEPLYADISALAVWGKVPWLRRLVRMPELHGKLLFGSDFPVPFLALRLWRDLGAQYRQIMLETSWPQRALKIYRHLGFNEIVFHRAARLMPHVNYFTQAAAS
ncbi:MAG: hypothetical protein ABIG44_10380 [Planctomycetota bacterium]